MLRMSNFPFFSFSKRALCDPFLSDQKEMAPAATNYGSLQQGNDDEIFFTVLDDHVTILQLAPTTIATMNKLMKKSNDQCLLDLSYFGLIKAAKNIFNENNPQSVADIKKDMATSNGLPDAYREFDQCLNDLKTLKAYFTKTPKCNNTQFLADYHLRKNEYENLSGQINTILETCGNYHGFVRNVMRVCGIKTNEATDQNRTRSARP